DAVGKRAAQPDVGIIGGSEYSRSAPVAAAFKPQDIGIKNRRGIKVMGVDPADMRADAWLVIAQFEPPIRIRMPESDDR
ncbi:MAG: hypothetical protein OEO18_19325, partial [Gammaproteobacteria bacterium]|nr:hypothetical protein [Gammaproteobacteria bacterium]